MLPEIWGKYGWNFIHLITVAYPENPTEEQKRQYYMYFHALKYVLPCAKCQYNMGHHLKKYPLTDEILSNRTNLVRWGIDLHNIVNYYTGKPMLTYNEAMNEINKLITPSKSSYSNIYYYFLVLIIFLVIGFFVYYYIYKKKN